MWWRCVLKSYRTSPLRRLSPLSQDTNLRGRLGRIFLVQRSCVPLSLEYRAKSVPGCPQDVNPQQYYPVAHKCSCRRCDARTHHCIRASPISYDRCIATLGGMKSQRQPAVMPWEHANTQAVQVDSKWYSCWTQWIGSVVGVDVIVVHFSPSAMLLFSRLLGMMLQ